MLKIRSKFKICVFMIMMLLGTPSFAMTLHDINTFVSDAAITTTIRTKMLADESLSNFKIDVGTVEGIVMIDGAVNSNAQAAALMRIIHSTRGVKGVDTSKLFVKQSQRVVSDATITSKVKNLFVREKLFNHSPMTIYVETKNGTVYLTGKANSETQAQKASDLAQTVEGVKSVEMRIDVLDK